VLISRTESTLPEECRGLSPRRFPWQTLKLRAMATAFRWDFERRLRRRAEALPA